MLTVKVESLREERTQRRKRRGEKIECKGIKL